MNIPNDRVDGIRLYDLDEELQSIIRNASHEDHNIDVYIKSQMQTLKEYLYKRVNNCITDDTYDQDYIDSNIGKVRDKLGNIVIVNAMTKQEIDGLVNDIESELMLKVSEGDNFATNEEIDKMIESISGQTPTIDVYTKGEIDVKFKDGFYPNNKLDTTGNVISTAKAKEYNTSYNNSNKAFLSHLDMISGAVTEKGIETPPGSNEDLIVENILKLKGSMGVDENHIPNFVLRKIINLPSADVCVNSDLTGRIHVANTNTIYTYNFDTGALLLTRQKPYSINGKTIGLYFQYADKTEIQLTICVTENEKTVIMIDDDGEFGKFMFWDFPFRSWCYHQPYSKYSTYKGYPILHATGANKIKGMTVNLSSLIRNTTANPRYSISTSTTTSNFTIAGNNVDVDSIKIYRTISNITYTYANMYSNYNTSYTPVQIDGIDSISNILMVAWKQVLISKNVIYTFYAFLHTIDRLFEHTANIIASTADDHSVYMIDVNKDIVVYNLKLNEYRVFKSSDKTLKHIYTDALDRIVIVSDTAVYHLKPEE